MHKSCDVAPVGRREGAWACPHGPCPVRALRLCVAERHRHLPRLRCPLCLRRLVFCRWLARRRVSPSEPEA